MRVRGWMLTAAAAGATAVLAWAAPAQAGAPVVLSEGHVDVVDVAYEGGALEISVHDETVEPGVERDPDDVLFVANPRSAATVPDDPRYAFLGSPGSTVYVLPEVQNESLLFPGLSTEELQSGLFTGDTVQVRFRQVVGPDGVSLFTTDPAGNPHVLVDSEDGLPDKVTLTVGTHLHENWAFEKAGWYAVKVDATATLAATGARVTSDPAWLKFKVSR